jgi:uncharacterized protein involved in exopolysaccharide biosynthesis
MLTRPSHQPNVHALPGSSFGAPSSAGLFDLREFVSRLRRRVRVIALTAAAIIALAVLALAIISPRYTASAILLADPRQQRVVTSEAVLAGIGSDAAAVESQVELIASRALAQRVVGNLGLGQDPEFAPGGLLGGAVDAAAALFGISREKDEQKRLEEIVDRFQEALKVQRRGLTYVLEVSFSSRDPSKAARITNAVTEAYLADQIGAKYDATFRASGWLNERLTELRNTVREAEQAVERYKTENNIIDLGAGQTLNERQISELNQQLILARARTAEARARLDQVRQLSSRAGPTGSMTEALQSNVIANLRAQHAQLASAEADLRASYGERHPTLANIRAQLAKVGNQIDIEVARIASGLRNEYEAARTREESLEASLTGLKDQSAGIGKAMVRLRELEREAQASRAVFEQFLLRFRETSEQQSLQKADVRIISPAAPPSRPSQPKTALILVVAAIGGLVAGVGLAAFLEEMR